MMKYENVIDKDLVTFHKKESILEYKLHKLKK